MAEFTLTSGTNNITVSNTQTDITVNNDRNNITLLPQNTGTTGATGPQGPQGDSGITVSATPPVDPAINDLWLDIG
jgi:hypothetical protein